MMDDVMFLNLKEKKLSKFQLAELITGHFHNLQPWLIFRSKMVHVSVRDTDTDSCSVRSDVSVKSVNLYGSPIPENLDSWRIIIEFDGPYSRVEGNISMVKFMILL